MANMKFDDTKKALEAYFGLYGSGAALYGGGVSLGDYVSDQTKSNPASLAISLLDLVDSFLSIVKNSPLGEVVAAAGIANQVSIIRNQQTQAGGIDSSNVVSLISDISALAGAGSLLLGPAGVPVFVVLTSISLVASVYATAVGVNISNANNQLLLHSTQALDQYQVYAEAHWSDYSQKVFNKSFYENPVTLPVLALLHQLEPNITPDKALTFIENSGSKGIFNGRIEEVSELMQSLVKMFFRSDIAPLTTKQAINDKINELWESFKTNPLAGRVEFVSPPTSASAARTDLAGFLSLYYLTPFALKPTDAGAMDTLYQLHATIADKWNDDRNLTTEQIANGEANYSDIYLKDRAAMLSWIIKANKDDTDAPSGITTEFIDKETNKTVGTGTGAGAAFNNPSVIFGKSDAETITGGLKNDDIFGGGGDDTLFGLDGNDYLEGNEGNDELHGEVGNDILIGGKGNDQLTGSLGNDILLGGAGNDTYLYTTGDGYDTILDSDGTGSIKLDTNTLAGGSQYGDARVHRDAQGHIYTNVGGSLFIDGNIRIQHWQAGNLGLNMTGATITPNPITTRNITGDFAPIDFDNNQAGIQIQLDDIGNLIVNTNTPETNRVDLLLDSTGNDHIIGGGGDDIITAFRGGDDLIEGGAGNDALRADGGNDVVLGGTGSDVLSGGTGNDRLYADTQISVIDAINNGNTDAATGLKADWLAGGSGDDLLIGSKGNDVLSGGNRSNARHINTLNKQACNRKGHHRRIYQLKLVIHARNPHGYWSVGHPLFNLNAHKTVANDATYNNTNERKAA